MEMAMRDEQTGLCDELDTTGWGTSSQQEERELLGSVCDILNLMGQWDIDGEMSVTYKSLEVKKENISKASTLSPFLSFLSLCSVFH